MAAVCDTAAVLKLKSSRAICKLTVVMWPQWQGTPMLAVLVALFTAAFTGIELKVKASVFQRYFFATAILLPKNELKLS